MDEGEFRRYQDRVEHFRNADLADRVGASLVTTISQIIDADEGLSTESRAEQIRLLVDFLLDYLDAFPDGTERALTALHQAHRSETLTYLSAWSNRLGAEPGARIRRALEPSDGHT